MKSLRNECTTNDSKAIAKGGFLLATLGMLTLICVYFNMEDRVVSRLRNEARLIREGNGPVTISIDRYTGFEWDHVVFVHPYTGKDKLKSFFDSQIHWLTADRIFSSEAYCLLVFLEDKKVVKQILVPRSVFDFSKLEEFRTFEPEQAVFEYTITKQSRDGDWLVVSEVR